MAKNFYITTTLPYVNSDPHVGFAMEIVRADAVARFHKLMGDRVFFNTGTDEHGLKIHRKAVEQKIDTQAYVDQYATKFKELIPLLSISSDIHFIRTTDAHHIAAAQEFWKRCDQNGYIYKKNYKVKYCVGCELEKTDSELVDGRCPIHPNIDIELIEEENYFFKFSVFQKPLLDLYTKNPEFVTPDFRFNEIKAFVERGLEDFSISRLKTKMPWGVPVPGDDAHVMYVWFDALVSYISTLGWPNNEATFNDFWANNDAMTVQYCGKDNLRQQSAMWQSMLIAAGLPNTKRIVINGFITSGGQKMSKSLGNVINPVDIVNEFGADALRHFVLRELSPFEDGDFTVEKFKESYNAGLANGIGNLASRLLQMALSYQILIPSMPTFDEVISRPEFAEYTRAFESFDLKKAADLVWSTITTLDKSIQEKEPFKKIKVDKEGATKDLLEMLITLTYITVLMSPLLPGTVEEITRAFVEKRKPTLFPRK